MRINKFVFTGDINFVDVQKLKIISLNFLKDQSLFWFGKSDYENEIKNEFPQIKFISYKIVNNDTVEIIVEAEKICCVIEDLNEKKFIISDTGKILRKYDGNFKSDIKFKTKIVLNEGSDINLNLTKILNNISNNVIKIEDIIENTFYLENEQIYFYTLDSIQVIINENTNFEKLNENLKSMKSYLKQNEKNYSILDFRFEKIVVK